jgi:hypothetical protein
MNLAPQRRRGRRKNAKANPLRLLRLCGEQKFYDFFDAKSFMNDASAWQPSTGMAL